MRTQSALSQNDGPAAAAAEKALLGDDETIDLMSVVGMLRRRKWLILLVTAIGTAAAALLGMQKTPEYTAQASVMVDPRQLQVTNIEQVLTGMPVTTATMATQLGQIGRASCRERV